MGILSVGSFQFAVGNIVGSKGIVFNCAYSVIFFSQRRKDAKRHVITLVVLP